MAVENHYLSNLYFTVFSLIGAIAGCLTSKIMNGGDFVFTLLGLSAGGLIGSIIMATVGAVLLLYVAKIIKKV